LEIYWEHFGSFSQIIKLKKLLEILFFYSCKSHKISPSLQKKYAMSGFKSPSSAEARTQ
jgi:hypothetical protein